MMKNNSRAHGTPAPTHCHFCANAIEAIDYKDSITMRKFVSSYGKIAPTRRSGVCAKHQRKLAMAIKRARIMAIMPFVNK